MILKRLHYWYSSFQYDASVPNVYEISEILLPGSAFYVLKYLFLIWSTCNHTFHSLYNLVSLYFSGSLIGLFVWVLPTHFLWIIINVIYRNTNVETKSAIWACVSKVLSDRWHVVHRETKLIYKSHCTIKKCLYLSLLSWKRTAAHRFTPSCETHVAHWKNSFEFLLHVFWCLGPHASTVAT